MVKDLVADGRLAKETADQFLIPARNSKLDIHPLVMLAQQEWPDQRHPGNTLNLETLTQWLANKAGLPYFRIDPLKIDVTAVTAVSA